MSPAQSRTVIVLALILLAAALVPPLSVADLPLVDYPDHLARMHVLADLDRDPVLARYYTIVWSLLPNLAMDLAVPPLMTLVDVYTAGRIFVVVTLIATVGGVFAVNKALTGRHNPFQLLVFPLLYNYAFLQGLTNYLAGIAVALWGIAWWIRLREGSPWRRALVSALFAVTVFFCHMSAAGLYGLALLSIEIARLIRDRRLAVGDAAAFGGPFLLWLPPMAISPTGGLLGDTVSDMGDKLEGLQWLFTGYNDSWDAIFAGSVGLAVVIAILGRAVRASLEGWVLLALGSAVFIAMPNVLFGSWGADVRLPVGLAFLLIPFFRLEARRPQLFAGAIAALALARFAGMEASWLDLAAEIKDFRHAMERIEPGGRILVAEADKWTGTFTTNKPLSHMACLAMIHRSAFVADAFTQPGKQILAVLPPYLPQSNVQDDDQPNMTEMVKALEHPDGSSGLYWAEWWKRFDYIVVLYTAGPLDPPPPHLAPLYDGRRFQLYKVI